MLEKRKRRPGISVVKAVSECAQKRGLGTPARRILSYIRLVQQALSLLLWCVVKLVWRGLLLLLLLLLHYYYYYYCYTTTTTILDSR